jgi:hypothetical protein
LQSGRQSNGLTLRRFAASESIPRSGFLLRPFNSVGLIPWD